MNGINPTIRAITADGWVGEPVVSNEPRLFRCCLEIGDPVEEAVDYFTLAVVNRPWIEANPGAAACSVSAPTWLSMRATLFSEAPSFEDVITSVSHELASSGPYTTWPEFARRMAHCMRWGLEGVPYPAYAGEA